MHTQVYRKKLDDDERLDSDAIAVVGAVAKTARQGVKKYLNIVKFALFWDWSEVESLIRLSGNDDHLVGDQGRVMVDNLPVMAGLKPDRKSFRNIDLKTLMLADSEMLVRVGATAGGCTCLVAYIPDLTNGLIATYYGAPICLVDDMLELRRLLTHAQFVLEQPDVTFPAFEHTRV